MKKLFFTLGAVLTMGIASAQVNSQGTTNTAGQINKPDAGTNNNINARPSDRTINQSATAPQSAVPVGGQNSNAAGMSNQTPSSSAAMSTSGAGGGSTVNTSSVPNTANTTNATTTQVPDKKKNN